MSERGDRANIVTLLAEAAYTQGRLDEALRLTEEGEALAGAGDFDAQGRWRATRAKLLARRGQFRAAVRLAQEAVALVPATCDAPERAEFLVAQAEVSRLAGALDQAEAGLRRALQYYQDRRMVVLAERTRALLASLTSQTSTLKPGTSAGAYLPRACCPACSTTSCLTLATSCWPVTRDGSACGRCACPGPPPTHTMCRLTRAMSSCGVTTVLAGACPADTAACPADVPPEHPAEIPQVVSASAAAAIPVTRYRRVLMTVVPCFRRPPAGRAG